MQMISLLEEIFCVCNKEIFKLDPMPWKDEKILIKNISTFSKRRMNVKGVRNLMLKDTAAEALFFDQLLEEYLITEVHNSETYVLITEYGLIYLNTYLSGKANDHISATKISKELFLKCSAEVLKRKCEGVFSIDISPQEAVLSLFLLLNGATSYNSAFQLLQSEKGEYLHGSIIINEINCIYMDLTNDEEVLIKDEKEFRNVIGRNGKNGRLAKAFPDIFQRSEGRIWFELDKSMDNSRLVLLKNMMSEIVKVLSKEYTYENISNSIVSLVEKYMINNPIEPYVLRDVFSGTNKFNHLIDLHIVSKDLLISMYE